MAHAGIGSEAQPAGQPNHTVAPSHNTKILMLGALGVVYGDIGTSPIYAFARSSGRVVGR